MEMPRNGPWADEDHFREDMITEWIAGSDEIPSETIAKWAIEVAARRPRKKGEGTRPAPAPKQPATPEEPSLALSVPEAARLSKVSPDHFRRHVMPQLRVINIGRRTIIPRAEVVRWLDETAAYALKNQHGG